MVPAPTGVLFSGGLDSAVLVGWLLDQGCQVQPIFIRGGLAWEFEELHAARSFVAALDSDNLRPLVELALPLGDTYEAHWSTTSVDVPDATTPDEAVYLPGRNALLLVKTIVWCHLHGIGQVSLAPLGSNPFADATDEFFAQFGSAMNLALGGEVQILRPFAGLHKVDVMRLGAEFPLELTFSCIDPAPAAGGQSTRLHCGRCNKCAERRAAFADAGIADRTSYADQHTSADRAAS